MAVMAAGWLLRLAHEPDRCQDYSASSTWQTAAWYFSPTPGFDWVMINTMQVGAPDCPL